MSDVLVRGSDVRRSSTPVMKQDESLSIIPLKSDKESKVLILYTGGTIGMTTGKNNVLTPATEKLQTILKRNPLLHDETYPTTKADKNEFLVLPEVSGMKRVLYQILQYKELIDSSNVTVEVWTKIALDIYQRYEFYDGFVVLHGTDTLAYTASALSFMCENLGKSVIVTGSQIPIFELMSDGRDNFIYSVLLAGNYNIPEVTVFFNHKLFRGNRVIKLSSKLFGAFESFNSQPLASVGVTIEVNRKNILRPSTIGKFRVQSIMSKNVGLIRFFPSITTEIVASFLETSIEGVVLLTYGAGNIPSNRQDLICVIKRAVERGVIVLNCTQCLSGPVDNLYETGKILSDIGVISGGDMTSEAALAKLSYVLSKEEWNLHMKRQMLSTNLRGELSSFAKVQRATPQLDILKALGESRMLTSEKEKKDLENIVLPALIFGAVRDCDMEQLTRLKEYGVDFNMENADSRTALHIACCQGDINIVRFLLLNGANVHSKDRYGQTPLMEAVNEEHTEIVNLLVSNGAHPEYDSLELGFRLSRVAAQGSVEKMRCYRMAGCNLNQTQFDGRTALHQAVLHDRTDMFAYLMNEGVDTTIRDRLGFTPSDMARLRGNETFHRALLLSQDST